MTLFWHLVLYLSSANCKQTWTAKVENKVVLEYGWIILKIGMLSGWLSESKSQKFTVQNKQKIVQNLTFWLLKFWLGYMSSRALNSLYWTSSVLVSDLQFWVSTFFPHDLLKIVSRKKWYSLFISRFKCFGPCFSGRLKPSGTRYRKFKNYKVSWNRPNWLSMTKRVHSCSQQIEILSSES